MKAGAALGLCDTVSVCEGVADVVGDCDAVGICVKVKDGVEVTVGDALRQESPCEYSEAFGHEQNSGCAMTAEVGYALMYAF